MAISLRDPATLKRIEIIQARREERDAIRATSGMREAIWSADIMPGSEMDMHLKQVRGAEQKAEVRDSDKMSRQQKEVLNAVTTLQKLHRVIEKTPVSKVGLFSNSEGKQRGKAPVEETKASRTPTLKRNA